MDKEENKMNNKTYLLSLDTLKTIGQGALGAMTFGAYHQFTTNRMMDMMERNHKKEIDELREKISNLEKHKCWFF